MSRKNCNAKRTWVKQYTFSEICYKMGIGPKQKLILRRYMLEKQKGR